MPSQQLIEYIKQAQEAGRSKEEIRAALLGVGWQVADVDEVFSAVFDSHSGSPNQSIYPISQDNEIKKFPGAFSLLKEALLVYKSKFFLFLSILAPLLAIMVVFDVGDYLLPNYTTTINASLFDAFFYFLSIFTFLFCFKALIHTFETGQENAGAKIFFKKSGNSFFLFISMAISFLIVVAGVPSIPNALRILSLGYSVWGGSYFSAGSFSWLDSIVSMPTYYFYVSSLLSLFFLLVWYSFSFFTLIFENRKKYNALLASAYYVRGYWLGTAWRYIFLFVIIFIFHLVISFVAIPFALLLDHGIFNIFGFVVKYIVITFTYPLILIFFYFVYKNLKQIKNGGADFIPAIWRRVGLVIFISIGVLPALFLFSFHFLTTISHDAPFTDNSDLRLENVVVPPEEQNGYYDLVKIQDTFEPKDMQDYLSGKKWDEKIVQETLQKNESAISFFAAAAKKEKFQDPLYANPDEISIDMKLTSMNSWRSTARLSALKAFYLGKQGKNEEAINEALNAVRIGQKIQNSQASTVEYLIAIAIKSIGLESTRKNIVLSQLGSLELKTYIKELNQFLGNNNWFANLFKGEYLIQSQGMDFIARGIINREKGPFEINDPENKHPSEYSFISFEITSNFYFQPNKTKSLFADFARSIIRNSEKPCGLIKKHEIKKPSLIKLFFTENAVGKILRDVVAISLDSLLYKKCEGDLLVSVTQLTAALKLHWLENSSYSSSLEVLAPKYIPKIPEDPFDGKSLRYSPEKKIIWSVGKDGVDSGGSIGDDWREMPDPTFSVDFGIGAINATSTPAI